MPDLRRHPVASLFTVSLLACASVEAAPFESSGSLSEWVTPSLSFISSHTEFSLNEKYYSGPSFDDFEGIAPGGPELWRADYDDPDGWLYGIEGAATLHGLRNTTVDFRYQTGDLNGDFRIMPLGGGPSFAGDADIDRDVWEIGATVPLLEWFYARIEYFNQQDDVDWKYEGGGVEKQEYELQGVTLGVGASQDMPLGDSGFILTLDAFVGAVYFDLEHEEKTVPVTTDWEGWGWILHGGAEISYPLTEQFSAVGGVGYQFMDLSDSGLDLENWTLDLTLGLSGSF